MDSALVPDTDAMPRALILMAGVGQRLSGREGAGEHAPKALLNFAGRTLLARHLDILRSCGIRDITLVIGYAQDQVLNALRDLPGEAPALVVNPDYREGSVVSLHAARSVLRDRRPVLLMDADVLYDARLMLRLLNSKKANCILLDRDIEPGDEPVKLCISGGMIVDFHKRPSISHEWHGESVGFFRFSSETAAELAERAETYVVSGRRALEYEEPIRDMIIASPAGRFHFEDISGLPWTEIDFPEDVEKACALLPALSP